VYESRSAFPYPQIFRSVVIKLFGTVTSGEVLKLIANMQNKSSPFDVLPTSLLKSCADVFAPTIAHVAIPVFRTGPVSKFPTKFKLAQVLPLLKKPGADR